MQAWRDVAWYDPEECLGPLSRLASSRPNAQVLLRLGLVPILADVLASAMASWAVDRTAHGGLASAALAASQACDAGDSACSGPSARHGFGPGPEGDHAQGGRQASSGRQAPSLDGPGFAGGTSAGGEERAAGGGRELAWMSNGRLGQLVSLSIQALCSLADDGQGRRLIRNAGLTRTVGQVVAAAQMGLGSEECWRRLGGTGGWILRDRHMALAMGQVCRERERGGGG